MCWSTLLKHRPRDISYVLEQSTIAKERILFVFQKTRFHTFLSGLNQTQRQIQSKHDVCGSQGREDTWYSKKFSKNPTANQRTQDILKISGIIDILTRNQRHHGHNPSESTQIFLTLIRFDSSQGQSKSLQRCFSAIFQLFRSLKGNM